LPTGQINPVGSGGRIDLEMVELGRSEVGSPLQFRMS